MPPLPEWVRLGPVIFGVEVVDEMRGDKGESLDGQIRYGDQIVRVRRVPSQWYMWQVFLHECEHFYLVRAGHIVSEDMPRDQESLSERDAELHSHAMLEFIVDNPHIFRFVSQKERAR
jgi:hypothetical protein